MDWTPLTFREKLKKLAKKIRQTTKLAPVSAVLNPAEVIQIDKEMFPSLLCSSSNSVETEFFSSNKWSFVRILVSFCWQISIKKKIRLTHSPREIHARSNSFQKVLFIPSPIITFCWPKEWISSRLDDSCSSKHLRSNIKLLNIFI